MKSTTNNLFSHIELQTAPVFQLLIGILGIFGICLYFEVSSNTAILFAFATLLLGIAVAIFKQNTLAFYVLSACIGFVLFSNSETSIIHFSNKLIPSQKATIHGKVEQIISNKNNRMRLVISGELDTKEFPKISNSSVLLNVYGKEKYLIDKKIQIGDIILCYCNVRPPYKRQLQYDFDEIHYTRGLGVNWIGTANANKVRVIQKAKGILQYRNLLFNVLSKKIDSLFTNSTSAFVKAILLADKNNLSSESKTIFSIAGVAHILALSGLHIGVISAILLLVLSFFHINVWIKFTLFSLFVVAFVFLTGMPDSAVRAGFMSILFMLGYTMQRETNMLNIVSIILLVSLVISPSMLYSVSFQLSMLSVIGIFVFYPIFKNSISNVLTVDNYLIKKYNNSFFSSYINNSLALTFSAIIIVNPLVAYYFGTLSIISPLTNIVIVPLFSLGLIFAVIAIVLSCIFFQLGALYAGSVELIIKTSVAIIQFAANIEFSAITDTQWITLIAILVSIALIYIFTSKYRNQLLFRSVIICAFSAVIAFILPTQNQNAIELYNKETYSLLVVPIKNNNNEIEKFAWIADRKPKQRYYKDIGLIKYFQNNNVKYVAINGNYGKIFVDSNLNKNNFYVRELSFAEQKRLKTATFRVNIYHKS